MSGRARSLLTLAVLVVLVFAGLRFVNAPGVPGLAGGGEQSVSAPTAPFLRLTLEREAATGAVEIASASAVETAVQPLTAMGGYYAVLDGGETVLAASPFAFPTHAFDEYRDASGAMVASEEVELSTQSVIVYLPLEPGATQVRILDTGGQTVATLDPTTVEGVAAATGSGPAELLGSLLAAIEPRAHAASAYDLQAQFPHIRFGYGLEDLSATHQGSVEEVVPIDAANAVAPHVVDALIDVLSELGERSPLLLGSIASIALVEYPNSGFVNVSDCSGAPVQVQRGASTVGNQIVINVHDSVDGQMQIVGADTIRRHLAHESVHAFHKLVDNASQVVQETLPPDVLTKVNDLRDNFGYLDGALSGTWSQLQASAQLAYSGYGSYEGANWKCAYPGNVGAVEAGFKRGYGSKQVFEDVATYVEMFYDRTQPFASHGVCQQFSGLDHEVPKPQLLAFAKLNFLRGLELIPETDYQACVQNADPADQDGFMLADRNYSTGLKAGAINQEANIANAAEGSRFVVLGSTSTGQAMLQIYARPPFYSPLGFHRLDDTYGWLTPYVGLQGLKRRNLLTWQPSSPSGNIELVRQTRTSSGGFALVVNNMPGHTKGYAFFVPMDDWMGRRRSMLELVWFRLDSD